MASQLLALLLACVLVSDTHALVAQLAAPSRRSDGAVMMAKAKSKAKKPKAKSAAGYRHFDTARAYQNEATIGAAIAASGLPREDFFITTKLWASDHGTDNTNAAIDQSLEALQTPYIDLLLLHGPDNGGSSAEEKIELRQQSWVAMEARTEARLTHLEKALHEHLVVAPRAQSTSGVASGLGK